MLRGQKASVVRIDPRTGWAFYGDERLDLSPKAFAVEAIGVRRGSDAPGSAQERRAAEIMFDGPCLETSVHQSILLP